ncbi:aminopeptidase N-like [Saccoglossus kowalevskii]|uniref:Aminopeptidase n=1 Tax=Saccoglossus kowalevskii TaxID=10224 RepID=A0ABM0GNV0_SACKO|nr:PREDICTED: aminopeptidase N-like [Saccoglossus kowalevskii]
MVKVPREGAYAVNTTDEKSRDGVFIRYIILVVSLALLALLFVVVILMVYFLHPGWGSPHIESDDALPTVATQQDDKPFEGRLPDNIIPVNYRIKIIPYLDEEDGDDRFSFDGEVRIRVKCVRSTSMVIMHALKLNIDLDSMKVTNVNTGDEMGVTKLSTDEEYDFVMLDTRKKLMANQEYFISMNYVGIVNNSDIVALYVGTYNLGGESRYFLASQLEIGYARRVFPSFDEPQLKATFDTIVKHRTTRGALSNMPNIRNDTEGDWNTAYFDTSPIMPTYLVAFVISDFVCKEAITDNGIKLRVWSKEADINSTDFALDFGVKALDEFTKMWGIDYPLTKLDMVSLPVFKFGAMENWGLVVYIENRLLYHPDDNAPERAQRAARIIGHELAHKWYGNLVTMAWWSDTWLNEGFARYFEFDVTDIIYPEWEIFDQFYPHLVTAKALLADASSESHATVRPDIGWPSDIWGQFDSRVYERGSCLIMMMKSILGKDVLYQGFTDYLNKYSYSNAYSEDLFDVLTETAKNAGIVVDMKTIMDPWVLQMGYPLITVTRNSDTMATATQKHFLYDPNDVIPENKYAMGYEWYVPLTYVVSSNMQDEQLVWLNKSSVTMRLRGVDSTEFILANVDQKGYFRVNYDQNNWDRLILQLLSYHETIPVINRAALIDDAFNLAWSGEENVILPMRLTEYLVNEKDYSPWKAARQNLHIVAVNMLGKTPAFGDALKYVESLLQPLYDKYGWSFRGEDEPIDYRLQHEVLELSCIVNNPDCVEESITRYSNWMQDPENYMSGIRSDMRQTMMCIAIRHGGDVEWNFAFDQLTRTNDTLLKDSISVSLACGTKLWQLEKYLQESYHMFANQTEEDDEDYTSIAGFMRSWDFADDKFNVYTTIGHVRDRSALGKLVAWNFLLRNFEGLRKSNEDEAFQTAWGFADSMNTKYEQSQLEDFARKYNDMPESQVEDFYIALRKIKHNIRWMETNYDILEDWLNEKMNTE